MSILEKAIQLLESMPQNKIEAVYTYIQFVDSRVDEDVQENDDLFMEALRTNRFVIPTNLGNQADEYIEELRKDDRF